MVAGIGGRAKSLREQLTGTALTAKSKQGKIELGSAAGFLYGIGLEETDARAKGAISGFPLHDTNPPGEAHDDEVRLYRIVIEIEEQLQKTGGGAKERHLASLQVTMKFIELSPKLVEVNVRSNAPRYRKTLEVDAKGAAFANNSI